MWKKSKPFVVSIAVALAVGGLSSLLTSGNMDLYSAITKPPLSPPALLFPIVWSILYILMGIGSALIWNMRANYPALAKDALLTYGVSLAVNFFWSLLFFNMRAFLAAFVWLCLLWFLIVQTVLKYRKLDKLAARLQIPYLLWVSFAGYLNMAIFLLNR